MAHQGPPDDLSDGMRIAAQQGDRESLENLLSEWKRPVTPRALPPNDLQIILRQAVNAKQALMAEFLLDQGSSFSEETLTPTFWAPEPPIEIYQLFLSRGWDINRVVKSNDSTLLMCETDKPHLVEWSLAHGSDLNVRDSRGWTAMDFAATESSAEVMRTLVQHGGDLSRSNALHAAAAKDPLEETDPAARNEVIEWLLREYGMDINAWSTWYDDAPRGGKNVSGTPLHRAIQAGNESTVEFPLKSGADRTAINVLGSSATGYAEEYGSGEIKKLLR